MMATVTSECPYRAGPCPKVEDLDETVKDLVTQVRRMNSYLMIIMGIIAVECGICVLRLQRFPDNVTCRYPQML